jgi:hypothetical protein
MASLGSGGRRARVDLICTRLGTGAEAVLIAPGRFIGVGDAFGTG